ncbi:bifunctional N(6)-L-threonylcarbamoyladenine synthase/serine/threonine protein kinase [Candidatus Woesearchaeota archaeon]|nr:bifunctional N(6)-L-threonylcarbamoyladenine synthase/serine/threonine protein kinase [Candidatus Woesearchaeota archaeon]
MIVLGIESTAHTFGIAVIDDKRILSNERVTYSTTTGGMIPYKVVEHHIKNVDTVLLKALQKANVKLSNVDLIVYSESPGIGHMLRVGAMVARSLAIQLNKPLVGVNHCIAHLEIGRMLTGTKDPVMLYASGANTQVIAYQGQKYRVFGETLDIGVGNFLDSFGRALGLGFPAGPKIEALAKKGNNLIDLPYIVKGMDVGFGGLLTNLKTKIKTGKHTTEDLCFSVQETIFAMLVEVSERAIAHTDKAELLLGGGVACNKRLQEMCRIMCKERGAKLFVPANEFLIDNAAMIAWQGLLEYNTSKKSMKIEKASIKPYLRTDDITVNWR